MGNNERGEIISNIIDLYHFGDIGKYDKYNPVYIYKKKWAPEILYVIANSNRYELTKYDLASRLNIEEIDIDDLLSQMEQIDMISKSNNKYSVSFTIFLEKDLSIIDKLTKPIAIKLSEKIIDKKQELMRLVSKIKCLDKFGYNRLFYHVIGCDILDGTALKEFADFGIFKISKPQVGERDYILIGFEKNEKVSKFSEKLLCSCNSFNTSHVNFLSFGDENGNRQDIYRFFRQVNSYLNKVTENKELNLSYIRIIERHNKHLAQQCAEVIKKIIGDEKSIAFYSNEEKETVKFLEKLQYVKLDELGIIRIIVPVFDDADDKIIGEVSNFLLNILKTEVDHEFSKLKRKIRNLSSVLHGIDEKEIANELWHQVFGNINEYLVKEGFFSMPEYKIGEGRYFQALYIRK